MTPEVKRLTPTKDTLIRLFAKSGNQCAFPECNHEVFSEETLVAQVCHISAAQQGGERFDSEMNNEQRRGIENLIILCHKHHKITDNVKLYPISSLLEMKIKHEERQNKELKLKESQLISIISEIETELSFKLDLVINKVDALQNRLDFYGRNKLSRGNHPKEEDFNLFFGKFLDDHVDVAALLLKAQPTIKDCEKIFTKKYYEDVFYYYGILYRDLLTDSDEKDRLINGLENKFLFEYKIENYETLENKFATKGITKTPNDIKEMFNKNVKLYVISFQEKLNVPGLTFWFWAFIDGRWVFFPKPNRIIRNIVSVRNNEDVKFFSKFLKRLMKWRILPKDFKKLSEDEMSIAVRQVMRQLKKDD